MKLARLSVVLVLMAPVEAMALDIAPKIVVMDGNDRSTSILLRNGSELMVEVEVDLHFGYEVADANGNVRAHYPKAGQAAERSAASFLRISPKRTRLAPGEERMVRVQAHPPSTLEPGEYWARASVRTVPVGAPEAKPRSDISLKVGVTSEQRIPIFVRHGRAAATAHVQTVRWYVDNSVSPAILQARYFVGIEGTGAFLGKIHATVRAPGGETVATSDKNLEVFESGWRQIRVALTNSIPPGAKLELQTERSHPGIDDDDLLPGGATRWSTNMSERRSPDLTRE